MFLIVAGCVPSLSHGILNSRYLHDLLLKSDIVISHFKSDEKQCWFSIRLSRIHYPISLNHRNDSPLECSLICLHEIILW